jgi:arsenate reductase
MDNLAQLRCGNKIQPMHKIYVYRNCETCRKALKWLNENEISYDERAIRETPPSIEELRSAMKGFSGDLRQLFNTSGADYRALGLKDKMSAMSEEEAITLLSENGNLVKRPFFITGTRTLTGFKPDVWKRALS